jgi:hypothetical protein
MMATTAMIRDFILHTPEKYFTTHSSVHTLQYILFSTPEGVPERVEDIEDMAKIKSATLGFLPHLSVTNFKAYFYLAVNGCN